jgi:hypothetical protein
LSSLALLRDKPIYLPNAEDPLEALSFVAYDHGWIRYVEQLRWLSDFFCFSPLSDLQIAARLFPGASKWPTSTRGFSFYFHPLSLYPIFGGIS